MSIATRPTRSNRIKADRNVSSVVPTPDAIPADNVVPISASIPTPDPVASVPTDPAPTLQTALEIIPTPDAPAPIADPVTDHASRVVRFGRIMDTLAEMIRAQTRAMVGYYADRGRLVLDGVNVKVAGAVDKKSRADFRDSAIKALASIAEQNYDATSEPKPDVARWVACANVVAFFPDAVNLPSLRVAIAIGETITRIDPPATWDAPESYAMKSRYDRDAVAALVSRAASDNMPESLVRAEIEKIGGRVVADAPAEKIVNPIDNASKLAGAVWEKIADKNVDPFTFFGDFVKLAGQYGFAIADTRDNMGAETHKLLKLGK